MASRRNSPCPCGSGKKFKACCQMVKADAEGVEIREGRRIELARARDVKAGRKAGSPAANDGEGARG